MSSHLKFHFKLSLRRLLPFVPLLPNPPVVFKILLLLIIINLCRLNLTVTGLSVGHRPESKFRDAISGYSVDLNEEEANKLVKSKLSLYSSSLNVLDGPPEDTQLAHSVLLVHKKKPPVNSHHHNLKPIALSLKMSTSPLSSSSSSFPSSSSTSSSSTSSSSSSSSTTHSSSYLSSLVNYSQTGAFTVNSKMRASSTSTTTTTTKSPLANYQVNPSTTDTPVTVKFSAHTLRPFPVYSSLNYGSKVRPQMIFRNFTQVATLDPAKDANLKQSGPMVINNHRPSPQPHRPVSISVTQAAQVSPVTLSDPFIASSSSNLHRRKPIHSSLGEEENEDDDRPVIVHSNHQKPFLGRLKLTSVDYNDQQWSTPTSFTEVPKTTNSPLRPSTPTSFVSIASRPPLKVASVHSNRQRHPEKIQSAEVTVIDTPGRNVTIVHQKLIVPYKAGRPKPGVSSVGTILAALSSSIRPRPNTTETGQPVTPADDAEVTTYYPRPAWTPEPPIPDSCCDATYPSVHLPSTVTSTPATTTSTTMATSTYDPHGAESSHVLVTRRPPYPVATVNAILAPPMPSRPISTPAPLGNTGILQSLLGVIGADSTGGLMSRLTLLKTALFTLLVMALPPLALIASLL